ncbi:MAG: galactokinase [Pseudomonadota bacterium]
MNRRDRLIARTRQGYRLAFGSVGPNPRRFFAAPGRVNLIGEHLDYNEGIVLPCAIDRETVVALEAGPEVGGEGYIELVAIDFDQTRDKIPLHEPIQRTDSSWRNLVRGVVAALKARGHEILPARLAIAGDIPMGAGLSSSASFAVAITLSLAQLSRISLTQRDLALIAQQAETDFLGTQCGIMDQMASAASEKDHGLLIDCRTLEHMPIPVSKELSIVIADSGLRRELVNSAFNTRRRECEQAAAHFGVKALRDVTLDRLEVSGQDMDPTLRRRARHVVSEIARVEPVAVALAKADTAALSSILRASHVSLRDDFEVTVPELDRLVDTIFAALGEGEGALGGVRMTGGGFGGCAVAIVKTSAVEKVLDAVHRDYNATAEVPASADTYRMVGGAREVTP